MLLRDLPHRIKRNLFRRAPQPLPIPRTRQDRATVVANLQQEVRRLQHEIAELSRPAESNQFDRDQSKTDDARVAAFEAELDRTQRELAKVQGRI